MNCPHVSGRVRHEAPTNGALKGGQRASGTLQSLPSTLRGQHRPPETFICAVCKSGDSPWLCLDCGSIHCGRYVKGHAKAHYKDKKHCISVDCYCLTAFCYICDSYIQKDVIPQPIIQRLILNLNSIHNGDSYSETSESTDEEEDGTEKGGVCGNSTEVSPEGCVNNVCDNKIYGDGGPRTRSGIHSTSEATGPAAPHHRRRRRVGRVGMTTSKSKNPRKRICGTGNGHPPNGSIVNGDGHAHSTNQCGVSDLNGMGGGDAKKIKLNDERDSSTERNGGASASPVKRTNVRSKTGGGVGVKKSGRAKENDATLQDLTKTSKHGVVGLRNLGNTCFMNAVLQSLSKIHGFSRYLSLIPPPDELNPSQFSVNPKPKYSTRSQKKALLSYKNTIKASTLGLCSPSDTIEIPTTEEFLTNELRKILIMLNTKGSSAVSPNGLFTVIWEVMPRFRGYQQQDAHEFLRYMLDRIHCELVHLVPKYSWNNLEANGKSNGITNGNQNGVSNNNTGHRESYLSSIGYKGSKSKSIVTSMFGGILQNEVRCCRCGSESKKNDPFLDLSLDIPCPPGGMTKLEDCLSRFIDIEELSDDDMCFCSNCKTHQKSTKRFWISHLPSVLCLHLKRFRFSSSVRSKLDHYVQFPMKSLDMSEYILAKYPSKKNPPTCKVYDLAAVIVHHGTGVGSGHYTAYAKKDVQWYHFNDSSVKPAEESAVAKCKAYILFYTHSDGEIKT